MRTVGHAWFGIGAVEDAWAARLVAPVAIREARALSDVGHVVDWAEQQAIAGRWVALLLAYEAGPAFDRALAARPLTGAVPYAWAACYEAVAPITVTSRASAGEPGPLAWMPTIDEPRFSRDISAILAAITAGDTYQVNYTFPLTTAFPHDPWAWFAACGRQARVPYPACIDIGSAVVMSVSPELFLQRTGPHVRTRPMKGTTRRGRWLGEDLRLSEQLASSDKARAENVMIVDLLRSDLGRVAETGSVRVTDLCALERYPTVWQLTSTVEADVRLGTTLHDLLVAMFPCGSITGAPKVRTMRIISDLESSPRGIYTGAICLLQPGGDLTASVPIRTAVLDRGTGVATFSVGAGITADSTAAEEWAECLAKARVVRPPAVPEGVALFETLRLEAGRCVRHAAHVDRLLASATLFDWPDRPAAVSAALSGVGREHPVGTWRVRLALTREGTVTATAVPFQPEDRRWRVGLASRPVDTRSPLLFNKTTQRDVYDQARAARPDVDDVVLWNARGEVTESTVGNLVLEIDGQRVTPPVVCGLLPGAFRGQLLASGSVVERVVRVEELARVARAWVVNSLREWVEVELVLDTPARAVDAADAAPDPRGMPS